MTLNSADLLKVADNRTQEVQHEVQNNEKWSERLYSKQIQPGEIVALDGGPSPVTYL
jgi:hypothetical protein